MVRFVVVLTMLVSLGVSPAVAAGEINIEHFDDGYSFSEDYTSVKAGATTITDGHIGDALRSTIVYGGHYGTSGHWKFADNGYAEPEELYWRYWIRFDPDFDLRPEDRGKLPGPAGLYQGSSYHPGCHGGVPSTVDHPCWSARMLFSRITVNHDASRIMTGFYAYHLDQPTDSGESLVPPAYWQDYSEREAASFTPGVWQCLEGHMKLNTPGVNDGVLEASIDGQPALYFDGLAFRRVGESHIKIEEFWFDVYYGGAALSPRNNTIDFDSLVLSSAPIGCDDTNDYPVSAAGFVDTPGTTFEDEIDWLAFGGITQGCGDPTSAYYCPDDPVTRGQMAAFLDRALSFPKAPDGDPFTDDAGIFEDEIERLRHAGVTLGCDGAGTLFCPDDPVTRGQMAAFLSRALGLTEDSPDDLFVDDSGIFETYIEHLSVAGITQGCANPTAAYYCPDSLVTRGQMAAFLYRALGP